jgi:hypothetical protein
MRGELEPALEMVQVRRRELSDPRRRFAHAFEGGGFGVGVTVNTLVLEPWQPEFLPPGVTARPTRLGELMPVAARSDAEIVTELQRVQQMEAQLAAYNAELVAELAARRPDSLDRQIGEHGSASADWLPGPGREAATGVSEFFADELAVVLNCSRTAATRLADSSALLTERLPATWAALADGQLDWPRARALAEELADPARDVEPHVLAEVEAAVLPRAGELSIRRLRAAARSELLRRDAAAADRRRAVAERGADVTVHPTADGMAELRAFLPQPLATAIRTTVDDYAWMARADGDTRSIGQLRAGVLADLVLHPWDTTRPPVTAALTVVAPLAPWSRARAGRTRAPWGMRLRASSARLGTPPPGRGRRRRRLRTPGAGVGAGVLSPPGSTGSPSPPPTCGRCSNSSMHSAPAGCRRRPAARSTSPWWIRGPAPSGPRSAGPNWNASSGEVARNIPATGADVPSWTGRPRSGGMPPRRRSAGSSGPGTAPAATRAAGTRPPGPIWTTSCHTGPVGRPPARTSAACAEGITGSRPTRRAGASR